MKNDEYLCCEKANTYSKNLKPVMIVPTHFQIDFPHRNDSPSNGITAAKPEHFSEQQRNNRCYVTIVNSNDLKK